MEDPSFVPLGMDFRRVDLRSSRGKSFDLSQKRAALPGHTHAIMTNGVKMKQAGIREHDFVVVCDGRKALLLENEGDHIFPHLSLVEVIEQSLSPDRGYHRHEPGRVHQSASSKRSRVEQTDRHSQAERDFLQRLAIHLENTLAASKRSRLFIVAPARALGMLRPRYTRLIRYALKAEVKADLVSFPLYRIEKMLSSQLH